MYQEVDEGGYAANSYELEGGTQMLAQECIFCSRALRDPASVERGCGSYCAAKHGVFVQATERDDLVLLAALSTAPEAMKAAVEPLIDEGRKAVSAAIHVAGRAWETRAGDAGWYIGSAMEIASALGYPGTARALRSIFIEGTEYDEDGNVKSRGKQRGIIVSEYDSRHWELKLPYLGKQLWAPTMAAIKAAGVRNMKVGSEWHTIFPGDERSWLKVLNALVPTLAHTLGVLPNGETFIVPPEPLPVPAPPEAEAPAGVGAEQAVEQKPGKLAKDAQEVESGTTVWWKGREMVVAWVSPDKVRSILVTPEAAEQSMRELGYIHGKRFGGVSVGMRDVSVSAPSSDEKKQIEELTDKPIERARDIKLPDEFFEHQREGALWLTQQGSGLLAFEQGLGKTGVGAVAAEPPVLVVCPKSIKENWVREIARWRPDLAAVRVEAGKEFDADADVVVVNYDIVGRFVEDFARRGFKTIICDESHYIKNLRVSWTKKTGRWQPKLAGSQRAKAVWQIANGEQVGGENIPHRYMLTGTPMDNRSPCEMFGQLHLVAPKEFPNFFRFADRYCDPREIRVGGRVVKTYTGATNTLELHERINGKYFLRKTKEVLDLPEKTRETQLISLDDATAKEYRHAASDLFDYIREQGGWEAMNRAQRAEVLVRMQTLRRLCGIGKVEGVVEQIRNFFESTRRPLVVFAHHREVQQTILSALRQFEDMRIGAITGDMSDTERQRNIDEFQQGLPLDAAAEQRSYLDVLVCSLSAAREGITLTRSQDVYFAERTWSPFHLVQAEDRTHRIGQKNKVTVIYFDAPGTIDEKIGQMLMKKLAIASEVLGGRTLSEEEVAEGIFGSERPGSMRANPALTPADWIDPD